MTENVMTKNVILSGVVGSTAYGLARPDSDVDRLGVYVAPSETLLGLHRPTEKAMSDVAHEPDVTVHELGKFLRLCLKGNPSVLELLWLPEYEIDSQYGRELRQLRRSVLSRDAIRNAYFGFAVAQLRQLQRNQVPEHRRAKHARHLVRLLDQLEYLWINERLLVRLVPWQVEDCHRLGELAAVGDLKELEQRVAATTARLDGTDSGLPEYADVRLVEEWLLSVRHRLIREEPRVGIPVLPH